MDRIPTTADAWGAQGTYLCRDNGLVLQAGFMIRNACGMPAKTGCWQPSSTCSKQPDGES